MKNVKICMIVLLLVSVGVMVQAQQSAFQGTWNGEDNRSGCRLEISGNNWSYYVENVIQAAGTARFSTGQAELLLANGKIYFSFTLLAPGLIYYKGTGWGHYRFRLLDYSLVAEEEFYDIADLASSAGVLSFMDEIFNDIILNALKRCVALEGVIISGPNGEVGFEKERGKAIIWINGSPRFKNSNEFSDRIFYLPLHIYGIRNVTIQAVARAF